MLNAYFKSITSSLTKFLIPALCLLTTAAHAGTFTLTGVDGSRGANVTVVEDGIPLVGYAGVITGTYNGTDVSPLFCVDLFTPIDLASYDSTPLAPRLARHEDRVAWLYLNQLSTVTSPNTGAAFQIAIWDIVHDNGDGLASGLVKLGPDSFPSLTSAQVSLINGYLAVSAGQSATTGVSIYDNTSLNEPAQNLIGAESLESGPVEPTNPVPEPATFGLMALGAAGMLAFRKLRGMQK